MTKQWDVNHIGEEKKCPTCGHSLGFSGKTEPPLTPDELRIVDAVMDKQDKTQEPPPCPDSMGVWDDEESDVQPQ